jgi:hypothetical protein
MTLKTRISTPIVGLALLASASTSSNEETLNVEQVNSPLPQSPVLKPGMPAPDGSVPKVEKLDRPNQTLEVPSLIEAMPTPGEVSSSKQSLRSVITYWKDDSILSQTLNLNNITSPSSTVYSLPSLRTNPFSLAAFIEP